MQARERRSISAEGEHGPLAPITPTTSCPEESVAAQNQPGLRIGSVLVGWAAIVHSPEIVEVCKPRAVHVNSKNGAIAGTAAIIFGSIKRAAG